MFYIIYAKFDSLLPPVPGHEATTHGGARIMPGDMPLVCGHVFSNFLEGHHDQRLTVLPRPRPCCAGDIITPWNAVTRKRLLSRREETPIDTQARGRRQSPPPRAPPKLA